MQKNKIGSKFSCFLFCCKFCWQMHKTQNACCGNAVLLQKSAQICLGETWCKFQIANSCWQLKCKLPCVIRTYCNNFAIKHAGKCFAQNSDSWCIAVTSLCRLIVILHVVFHFVCLLPNRVACHLGHCLHVARWLPIYTLQNVLPSLWSRWQGLGIQYLQQNKFFDKSSTKPILQLW